MAPYRFPCVMDLKMGTSHRSPDASEAKKRMLEERWMSTTSSSLGFRMCGIQVRVIILYLRRHYGHDFVQIIFFLQCFWNVFLMKFESES